MTWLADSWIAVPMLVLLSLRTGLAMWRFRKMHRPNRGPRPRTSDR